MSTDSATEHAISLGQQALARGSWQEARQQFEASLLIAETAVALEGLSWAAWWQEDIEACLTSRERAYHQYRGNGDVRGATRMALWLGDDHLEFLGAGAVADGWFGRASRLLRDLEPSPEHGWLAVFEAHGALGRGDLDDALHKAQAAQDVGRQHGAIDLEMFGLATEGVIRINQGDIREGLRMLDEATASAVAGEYENLVPAAWSCCLVMSSCEQVRDFDRADQWCRQIDRFSRRMDARFVKGVCRAHQGALRVWRGEWDIAEQALTEALEDLTAHRPSYRSEGIVRLGQLRYRQGRIAEAQELFERSGEHPLALLGFAAIHLDQEDHTSARDLLERLLRQSPAGSVNRIGALELLVRVETLTGDLDAAAARLDELRTINVRADTEALSGSVLEAEGILAMARANHQIACDRFEDASAAFLLSHMPVDAARARLLLAESLLELGRGDSAGREARLAVSEMERVGAVREINAGRSLLERLDSGDSQTWLTTRQLDVLRLIAAGQSDQQIAATLFLSPHTVHRHVANILDRLGCATRAAAVAEAGRLNIL